MPTLYFEVQSGTWSATATSYCSIAVADQYSANRGGNPAWEALDTAGKQARLNRATSFLDGAFGTQWRGRRQDHNQALDWPRYDVEDDDGNTLPYDVIPLRLQQATAEAAITDANGVNLTPDPVPSVRKKKVNIGQGAVETEIEYANGTFGDGGVTLLPVVNNLLSRLIGGSSGPTYPVRLG